MPVWVDQFGIKKRKPILISLVQAGSVIGVVIGYTLTVYIKQIYSVNKNEKNFFKFIYNKNIIFLLIYSYFLL
jgi:hypothetical protein